MKKLLLILIILLAFILRFYRLGDYPALNADEAAIGYNAYSLLETGKDEHGNPWPIHFQSFNDFKPGLYFYMVLPFVKILGLNEWAVRVPGAILGVISVYLIYLFVKKLEIGNGKSFSVIPVEIVASVLLAISPWHIHFSRGGWEVNVATFFITLGLLFFLKALERPSIITFTFPLLSFVLSLYTYHAARIISPILLIGLLLIYKNDLKKYWKGVLISGFIGILFLSPLIKDFTKPEIYSRASGVGIFADSGTVNRTNEQRGEHLSNSTGFQVLLIHNKVVNYGLEFLKNWSEHYNGNFLFLTGDLIQRNKVPETGQMYLSDILWFLAGIWWFIKNIKFKSSQLVILWLIAAPMAAAFTFQSPHALRAHNMVIPTIIISAFGLVKIVDWFKEILKNKYLLTPCYLLLVIFVFWQFARYEHMYWVHMAKEYPFSSQYGVKELVKYIDEYGDDKQIVVTDRYDQPYILFLFYKKYPPQKFQDNHKLTDRDAYGFSTVGDFDKYIFKKINWESDKAMFPGSLIVGTDEEIPDSANVIAEIYGTNGYKYFQIVAN